MRSRHATGTRNARTPRPHWLRGVVAVALVFAHVASAVGFPQVRSATAAGCAGGACGCGTAGAGENCACSNGGCHVPVKPAPAPACSPSGKPKGSCCGSGKPAPRVEGCAKCQAESPPPPAAKADDAPVVIWVLAVKARQCRGEGPLGVVAESPSVPPQLPVRLVPHASPVGRLGVTDARPVSISLVPDSPPPKVV